MPFYVNLATSSVFKACVSLLTDQILCEIELNLHVLTSSTGFAYTKIIMKKISHYLLSVAFSDKITSSHGSLDFL